MDSKNFHIPLKTPPLNLLKFSSQPMQISNNYMPFYSPISKAPTFQYTSTVSSNKPFLNQEIFQQQTLKSPKTITNILQQQQQFISKKSQDSGLLNKFLNNGQGLLTQREPIKNVAMNNGSVSERSLLDKKKWFKKEQDSSVYDKENKNTLNISKGLNLKTSPKSNGFENLEQFFITKGKVHETMNKMEFSKNFSRQEELISEENSQKFNLLTQRLEISKNILHQTPIASESEQYQEKKTVDYQEFLKEMKFHKSEIVDLKNETKDLKEKVSFLESQLQESDRRKKLDDLNDLLNKANLENKMIRKKTKNRELKRNNYTQGTDELIKGINMDMNTKKENPLKKEIKTKLEFKKLFQKTDLSKFITGVENKGKIMSEGNSKNNDDLKEILKRKLSNDINQEKLKHFFKEDKGVEKEENAEKANISESLNTLKHRLANFLNNNGKKKFAEKKN